MKLYKIFAVLVSFYLLCSGLPALAAGVTFRDVAAAADADSGVVTVGGTVSEAKGTVVLFVLKEGKTAADLMEHLESLKDVILFSSSAKADAAGAFRFSFDMRYSFGQVVQTGTYPFVLACGDVVESDSYTVSYVNTVDLKNALKAVNDAADAAGVEQALIENQQLLGLDGALLSACTGQLTAEGKQAVFGGLAGKSFTSAAPLVDAFAAAAPWRLLQDGKTAAQMKENINDFNGYYQFDLTSSASDFARIELDANKTIVFDAMIKSGRLTTPAECAQTFLDASALGYLNDAAAPGTVRTLAARDCFGIDMAPFLSLSAVRQDKVLADMVRATIPEISGVKPVWDGLVETYRNWSEPSSGGSSGGSGGKGGNKTNTVNLPSVPPVIPPVISDPEGGGEPEADAFSDLASVPWAKTAITELAKKGIVSGREAGKFEPEGAVTRAEFVKMITLAFGFTDGGGAPEFTDVAQGAWYYSAVAAAAANGIVIGGETGAFAPDAKITREDVAVTLARAAEKKGVALTEGEADFADAQSISDYAASAVGAMRASGVLSGRDGNLFAPKENATRAEASKMIYELMIK